MIDTPNAPVHNLPELSVSELSGALKRTIEEAFSRVRVRGEISQPKVAGSGHCYLRLKDDQAVIDAIIWRGTMAKLALRPEEGLEVIAIGRLTTYPGRSSYQIVIESLELAGEGALLKMLEERRRRLAAEGLFDAGRKRRPPFLPSVIGVITSPTGAVIRDILHRLADRFPRPVLVWPVAVQGEGAAAQIAAAITGFNALPAGGPVPRPDVLIVARGGGSLEDLMAFNDEAVVRAASASAIPLISAVGHETDTTLIDHAADLRAPTPTEAAEMAVPVRLDLLAQVRERGGRLDGATLRLIEERRLRIEGLGRGLPDLARLIGTFAQRLDDRAERLEAALPRLLDRRADGVFHTAARLRGPGEMIARKADALERAGRGLETGLARGLREAASRLDQRADRLRPGQIARLVAEGSRALTTLAGRLDDLGRQTLVRRQDTLEGLGARLDNMSYRKVLERGYAVVRDATGAIVPAARGLTKGDGVVLDFRDGRVAATIGEADPEAIPGQPAPETPPTAAGRSPARRPRSAGEGRQGDLLKDL
ncbi:exodeoxyribonuclease VII large subunit [Rhodospirillum rubrum F11]|uniref:exodeoxyribonuclease VII large subunit n=1 Tax=Rhodospirillum rubrum TaxID=1085 RepID=UPI000229D568|nr:exodeoxyribonuclease VII large subunit [Rhodospirillum rubrum]AEO46631.1 exodeoxyribonuclease VII large subunit [Rhodospirillum rubrum F11]